MSIQTNNQHQDHFDLLPFIAILMCLLGTLLLVTISIAALSIGPGVGEGWIPIKSKDVNTKTPVLIEWDGTHAVLHRKNKRIELKWLPQSTEEYWKTEERSPEHLALLDSLRILRITHYALFAVRPSGFDTFNAIVREYRKKEIDVGYEPIEQNKSVRLLGGYDK